MNRKNTTQEPLSIVEKIKDIGGIFQTIVTTLAIVFTGIWFLIQGTSLPRATISHSITHVKISDKYIWVHVSVKLENVGKRRIHLKTGYTRIQQIMPLNSTLIDKTSDIEKLISQGNRIVEWPLLGKQYDHNESIIIEPDEYDIINYEFIIPSYIQSAKIYSFFDNLTNTNNTPIGWRRTTIYEFIKSSF